MARTKGSKNRATRAPDLMFEAEDFGQGGMVSAMTPGQRIHAAHLHYNLGVPQEMLSQFFLTNNGRINEACKAIEYAANNPKKVRTYHSTPRNPPVRKKTAAKAAGKTKVVKRRARRSAKMSFG